MAQRFAVQVEPVDEHAVGAEVCGEREAVRRIGNNAMRMRRFLPLGIRPFARVLHHMRGTECAIRLDRQQPDVAPGVVGDEPGAAPSTAWPFATTDRPFTTTCCMPTGASDGSR